MEKYSDYIILQANSPGDLSKEVKQYLKDGWVLLGAPFAQAGQGGPMIMQALIKPDSARPGSIGFNLG